LINTNLSCRGRTLPDPLLIMDFRPLPGDGWVPDRLINFRGASGRYRFLELHLSAHTPGQ